MIRVGETIDAARRRRIVTLIVAAIGHGREQLASERVIALAPTSVVTVELAAYVERLLGMAVPRCVVCLEPGALHEPCEVRHEAELDAARDAGAIVLATIGPRRRR